VEVGILLHYSANHPDAHEGNGQKWWQCAWVCFKNWRASGEAYIGRLFNSGFKEMREPISFPKTNDSKADGGGGGGSRETIGVVTRSAAASAAAPAENLSASAASAAASAATASPKVTDHEPASFDGIVVRLSVDPSRLTLQMQVNDTDYGVINSQPITDLRDFHPFVETDVGESTVTFTLV
jgi:hypothetical protein